MLQIGKGLLSMPAPQVLPVSVFGGSVQRPPLEFELQVRVLQLLQQVLMLHGDEVPVTFPRHLLVGGVAHEFVVGLLVGGELHLELAEQLLDIPDGEVRPPVDERIHLVNG